MSSPGTPNPQASPRYRDLTPGKFSLILLTVNAAVITWAYWATGDGVDSGLGFIAVILYFSIPAAVITMISGLRGITQRRGRTPGVIAVSLTTAALGFLIIGFITSQVL